MKKIVLFLITIALFSCSEDLLDRESVDIITEDKVWKSTDLTEAHLIQSYVQTTVFTNETEKQEHISTHHFLPFIVNSVSDESRFYRNWSGNAHRYKKNGIKIEGGLLEWWEIPYKVIRNLNEFISKAPNSTLDADTKKIRIAEARFLRAFNYFYMVKRYGGVPLVTKVISQNDPEDVIYPKRNTEKEVYDYVISEVDAIANILPEQVSGNEYGRASKYAALALKSRAALYAASIAKYGEVQLGGVLGISSSASEYFQKSINASNKIINSGLFDLYNKYPDDKATNFRNIFLDERNIETIFAKQHDATSKSEGGNGYAYDFFQTPKPNGWGGGTQNEVYLEMVESFEYTNGTSGKLDRDYVESKLWTTDELWANKDPRFFATIYTHNTPWQGRLLDYHKGIVKPNGKLTNSDYGGLRGTGASARYTGFGVLKYLDETKNNLEAPYSSQTDWIVFRYAEILLNYAEAQFEIGNTQEALNAVNKIRKRAGIAPLISINLDKIRHERKVELAFEGHRYWDLRRWRIAKEVLTVNRSGIRYAIDFDTKKLKIIFDDNKDSERSSAGNPIFFDHNYYFPITLKRTSINKNLVENPGY